MALPLPLPVPALTAALADNRFDALILIAEQLQQVTEPQLANFIQQAAAYDHRIGKETLLLLSDLAPGHKLILAPTGLLQRDVDDVRSFADVAKQAIVLAKNAGAVAPLVWVLPAVGASLCAGAGCGVSGDGTSLMATIRRARGLG